MKKVFVSTAAAVLALTMGTAVAQDQAGGSSSGAFGEISATTIAAGAVGVAVAAAVISNSRGTTVNPEEQVATCDDGNVPTRPDGFCLKEEVIVTGTGTNTFTQLVTSTYAPTVK
ncbi:hypothetical protein ABC502_07380 [Alkalimonas sp. NCh-2]|uniref:hypothetical protein n=1 Tax=Alkalimonas sp. NCh-2 TaxID=3144846 RepID=UPI0031F5F0C5